MFFSADCLVIGASTVLSSQPNIVFIFSDDHATQALSAYGHEISKIAQTPHIDKVAESRIRFDRCLVGNSICGPLEQLY